MQAVIQHQKQKRHRSMRWFRGFIQTRLYDLEYVVDVIGGLNYNVNLLGNITNIADTAGGNNYQGHNVRRFIGCRLWRTVFTGCLNDED